MIERAPQTEPHLPTVVTPGEPFSLSPDFSRTEQEYRNGDSLVASIPFETGGNIAGQIDIVRCVDAGENLTVPIRTPAGPIKIEAIMDNGKPRLIRETLPVEICVRINGKTKRALGRVAVQLICDGNQFNGRPDAIDVKNRDTGRHSVQIGEWSDSPGGERAVLYFPQDGEVFKKVQLVVNI